MLEVVNMNGPGPEEPSFGGQTNISDEEALQILQKVNVPHNDRSWSQAEPKGSPMSPTPSSGMSRGTTTQNSKKRTKATPSQLKIEDVVALKTTRFWENWAGDATEKLMTAIFEQEEVKKELLYSGRCGTEPKFYKGRSGSSESIHTDISLLACSDLMPQKKRLAPKHRKPKVKKIASDGPNWEMFAKTKKGMLDRFIQADASRMEGYMKARTGPIQNVTQRTKATDIMTKHERKMLNQCAYRYGPVLANNLKSDSTANIVTVIKSKVGPETESEGEKTSDDGKIPTPADHERNLYDYEDMNQYKATGRTPSPQAVTAGLRDRPESAVAALVPIHSHNDSSWSSASSDMLRGSFSRLDMDDDSRVSSIIAPTTMYRRHSHIHGLPDLDGIVNSKVRKRIHTTLKNLSKATGYGDRTDVCTVIEEEQGLYTETDYAKHPRYPQHIKIAPALSRVIREDIRERMGRPRHHAIRLPDIQAYDNYQPKLGRSQRNLLIFNWLNEISETGFSNVNVPEIKDLEGTPPNRTYSDFVPGIVGENLIESEDMYRGSRAPTASRYGAMTMYASSRYGGATNYEPSRFGGTTYFEESEEESEFTSDDSFYE